MGRKKKTFGKMDAPVNFQVTPEQKEMLEEAAKTAGYPEFSSWLRSVIFPAAEDVLKRKMPDHDSTPPKTPE